MRDNGIGMDAATMARVQSLRPGRCVDDTEVHGGTGLGLVISTRLVEAMGGEIRAESTRALAAPSPSVCPSAREDDACGIGREHRGCTPLLSAVDEAIRQGQLILVAEDNETNRSVIERQLAKLRLSVRYRP